MHTTGDAFFPGVMEATEEAAVTRRADGWDIGAVGVTVAGGGTSYFWICSRYESATGTALQLTSSVLVLARTNCTLPGATGFSVRGFAEAKKTLMASQR